MIKINDYIKCPKCGKEGRVASTRGSSLFIVHKTEWKKIRSETTGKEVNCEVVILSCRSEMEPK